MVPFRLDQTAFNDQSPPVRTMADFFLGTKLTNSAAPSIGASALEQKMGRDHHFSLGVQQRDRAIHGRRAELRRQHRPLPERHDQHQHSRARRWRHPGSPPVSAIRQHQLLRRYAGDHLPLAADLDRTAHARWPVLSRRPTRTPRASRRRTYTSVGGNHGREKALSAFDVPHNLALSAGYELPFGRGRRFLRNASAVVDAVLGGWQVQGIYIWRSGRPFTPTISSDRANTGVGGQRPDRVGSGEIDDPTVEVWFDKTAFVLPAQFTYGEFRRRHPARGQLQDTRLLAVQAVQDRNAAPAIPRGGLQPDQHAELQRAEYRDRHCRRRTRHQHARALRARCSSL